MLLFSITRASWINSVLLSFKVLVASMGSIPERSLKAAGDIALCLSQTRFKEFVECANAETVDGATISAAAKL